MAKTSLEDLRYLLTPLQGYVGRKIQHKRTGGWYVISGIHYSFDDDDNQKVWFSYHTMHKEPVSFIRPIEELTDGRFEIGEVREYLSAFYQANPGRVVSRP